MILIFNHYFFN